MSVPHHSYSLNNFNSSRFESQVNSSLSSASRLLASNRHPVLASQSAVPHEYRDKYLLAELLTKLFVSSSLCTLENLGLNSAQLSALVDQFAVGKKSARRANFMLEFSSSDKCSFLKETTRKVESDTQNVTEVKSSLLGKISVTDKTVTKITEYYWTHEVYLEIFLREAT